MSEDPITISPEMYLIIQGQVGNIRAKLKNLQRQLVDGDLLDYIPVVEECVIEVDFMQRYLPLDPSEIQNPSDGGDRKVDHEGN